MLRTLRDQQKKVEDALAKLPLALTTLKLKKTSTDLEAKLKSISDSIALFEKPTVYVKK